MNIKTMLQNMKLDVNMNHVHLQFDSPVEILSSAVLNGGYIWASHILNMRVPKNVEENEMELLPPSVTLRKYMDKHNLKGTSVGMMTAASMDSFSSNTVSCEDVIVESFITVGLSNARRAGDPADLKSFGDIILDPGTINIILGTNAKLSSQAMVEAIMIASEAKAAIMQELNIISPISKKIATGTGTDSIVFFNGSGRKINYCGKHVLFGEMIASSIANCMKDSIKKVIK